MLGKMLRSAVLTVLAVAAIGAAPAGSYRVVHELDGRIIEQPPAVEIVTLAMLRTEYSVPVAEIEGLYPDVNRREYLAHLVRAVTKDAPDAEGTSVRWVEWLQNHFAHPERAPLDEHGAAIFDPLWLLLNRVAHCGQTNRLIADGLSAVGIETRIIRLRGHIVAEAYFDGAWHYLDADVLDFGDMVRTRDGRIPSTAEIVADRSLLKSVSPYREVAFYPGRSASPLDYRIGQLAAVFESEFVEAVGKNTPLIQKKTAAPEEERGLWYGWEHYQWVAYTDEL